MTIIDTIRGVLHPEFDPEMDEREVERLIRERNELEAVRDHVQALGNALNGGNKVNIMAGVVLGLLEQHRYLQNEAIVTLLTALGEFGALPEGTTVDARNEFAYRLCQKLRQSFKDELFWKDR